MRATVRGDRGVILNPPLSLVVKLHKELPKPVVKPDKITFAHDRRAWTKIREICPELELPPEALRFVTVIDDVRRDDVTLESFPYKTKPYKHQDDGLKETAERECVALLMEMGTGKSKVSMDTAAYLWAKGKIEVMLVVAPSGVNEKWIIKEVEDHLPDWVPRKAAFTNTTTLLATLDKLFDEPDFEGLIILSVNTELFSSSKQLDLLNKTLAGYDVLVVVDESTRFKNTDSNRWESLRDVTLNARYVRLLTGSPVTRHVDDLYGQFKLMMENIAGERTLTGFRARFCEQDGEKYNRVVGSRNLDELGAWLAQHSFIRRKKDCLDLPPKMYLPRKCPLSAEQRKHYDALRDELVTYLNGEAIEVEHVMAKVARLAQVCSGFLVQPSTGAVVELDCKPRMDALREIVDEADAPVVIFTRFKPEVKRICREFNWAVPYTGDESKEQRAANLAAFQRGELRALVGTMAAGGIGLDMTVANQMIYFSHTFDAEHRWQSEDRIHRIGQLSHSVTYHELYAPGTVDTKMLANNRSKLLVAETLFESAQAPISKQALQRADREELRQTVLTLLDGRDPVGF